MAGKTVNKSAEDGKFVSNEKVKSSPSTTYVQKVKPAGGKSSGGGKKK